MVNKREIFEREFMDTNIRKFKVCGLLFVLSFITVVKATFLEEVKEYSKIIALSVAAANVYGNVESQISMRVCPESFTEGSNRSFVENDTSGWLQAALSNKDASVTAMASIWGVMRSWWVGLPYGVLAAIAARAGNKPKLSWRDLVKPTVVITAGVGLSSAAVGLTAYHAVGKDPRTVPGMRERSNNSFGDWTKDSEKRRRWLANEAANDTACVVTHAAAGYGLATYAIFERDRRAREQAAVDKKRTGNIEKK